LRNKEIHSGISAYSGFRNGKWLPDLFRVVKVLSDFIGRDLEDLLGDELAAEAAGTAEASAKQVISDVRKKMAEAAKGLEGLRENELEARRRAADESWMKSSTPGKLMFATKCPVCESRARTGMVHVRDKPAIITEDSEVLLVEIYAPRNFECRVCGVELEGVSELKVCDLADQQEVTYTQSPSDFFLIEHDYDGPEYDNE
jgi:hypothetical protein